MPVWREKSWILRSSEAGVGVSEFDLRAIGNVHTACHKAELGADIKVRDHIGRVVGEGQVWTGRAMAPILRLGIFAIAVWVRGKPDVIHLELIQVLA